MATVDRVVRGKRVLVDNISVRPAAVYISNEKIIDIRDYDDVPADVTVLEADEHFVLPGVVDTHVHINEPGRTEWEGFWTATRGAASGGITTLCDMPLNSDPPTTTLPHLQLKMDAAKEKLFVDTGFLGGVVPGSHEHVTELIAAGVRGFKCFLCYSGIEEFPGVDEAELHKSIPLLKESGSFLMYHAETPHHEDADNTVDRSSIRNYMEHLKNHVDTEPAAVALVIRLAEEFGIRSHIVHLSMAESVELVASAKARGVPITAETCPHYLTIAAEDIPDGATYFKCCPPIRERANQDPLWAGLESGALDMIVCDHSPCPPELKQLDLGVWSAAWGGISSVQVSFVVAWTEARKRGYTPQQIMTWMSANPAILVGLGDRKGSISIGKDADFVVLDDKTSWTIRGTELEHRHKLTPYDGREVSATVRKTILRGAVIYDEGTLVPQPRGQMLLH